MAYSYEYPRPALTVDCVVFGLDEGELKVLLVERDLAPFKGKWALPGGFVRMEESLEERPARELRGDGIEEVFLEQLYTFGDVERDPRGRVVSVAYYALVNLEGRRLQASTDVRSAAWFCVSDVPSLAFDHHEDPGDGASAPEGKSALRADRI